MVMAPGALSQSLSQSLARPHDPDFDVRMIIGGHWCGAEASSGLHQRSGRLVALSWGGIEVRSCMLTSSGMAKASLGCKLLQPDDRAAPLISDQGEEQTHGAIPRAVAPASMRALKHMLPADGMLGIFCICNSKRATPSNPRCG